MSRCKPASLDRSRFVTAILLNTSTRILASHNTFVATRSACILTFEHVLPRPSSHRATHVRRNGARVTAKFERTYTPRATAEASVGHLATLSQVAQCARVWLQ